LKKLLLIDNSTVIINVLKDLFSKKNNYEVFIAKTLKEAEDLVNNNKFFVSISNLVLPDALNGEHLNFLKTNQIPTIVLTSKINDENIAKIKKVSVVDYISKESIHELKKAYKLASLLLYVKNVEVLIVDDSATVISQLKDSLESLLLNVNIASSGKSALKQLEKNSNISLIITDYHMDEMNGLELIKKIRKSDTHSSVPILVMTSENSNDLKIDLYKNGATDFLVKPLLEEELKAKIFNAFSNMKQISEIRRYTKVIDSNVITSSTDEEGRITSVSEAFCKISGYSKSELIGNNHKLVRHPDMPESLYTDLWKTIREGKVWNGEVKNLRKDNTFYWVKVAIHPDFDNNGKIVGYTSVREDITDKKKIYELSITDGLTSLFNRRHFNDTAQSFIDNCCRSNNSFGFLILDIDNFKKYNDTYGHQKGDTVLKEISTSLLNVFKRSNDLVFRLGGEEFGVLINANSEQDIKELAEKARKDIEDLAIEHQKNSPSLVVTASFGLLILSEAKPIDEIYKIGDELLYKAKEEGRNRVLCTP